MDLSDSAARWRTRGFEILPAYLPADVLRPAVAELDGMFPSAQGFHDGSDPRRDRFVGDEFAGIDTFPFGSTAVSLLAVHDRLVRLAETFLGTDDLRMYSAEAWAKYTGAADYEQSLHRDYLNHTVLVPSDEHRQLELFVYLDDVPDDLGPPRLVPRAATAGLPAVPNWLTRGDPNDTSGFVTARPDLYDHEVSAAGPSGTVVAFELGTFHRGTALTRPGGARYTLHLSYRRAGDDWGQRVGWADRSHLPEWYRLVPRATPRQLALLGFPPPGHPYWTPDTLAGLAARYPGLDTTPWRS